MALIVNGWPRYGARRASWVFITAAVLLGNLVYFSYVRFSWRSDPRSFLTPRPITTTLTDPADAVPLGKHDWNNSVSLFDPVSEHVSSPDLAADPCDAFPRHVFGSNIQAVLRMGHDDMGTPKLDAQLNTTSACVDNLLILSDAEEEVGTKGTSIDVLADIAPVYRREDSAFRSNYDALKQHLADGSHGASYDGKLLDKYKFLPMVERAWKERPGRDWYVFYEPDTYIFWDNMFRFLGNLDPESPLYVGAPSKGRRIPDTRKRTYFANGGTGIVLSRAGIRTLLQHRSRQDGEVVDATAVEAAEDDSRLSTQWIDLIMEDCCGDSVLGWALYYAGIPLAGFWPLFNPFAAHQVPYSSDYWCHPLLTLHKTHPDDVVELYRWEAQRRRKEFPLLHRDLYDFKGLPGGGRESGLAEGWDNGRALRYEKPANSWEDESASTPHECRDACGGERYCMQWNFHGEQCVLSKDFRRGSPREPELLGLFGLEVGYVSGWMADKIDEWREHHACEEAVWIGPRISKTF